LRSSSDKQTQSQNDKSGNVGGAKLQLETAAGKSDKLMGSSDDEELAALRSARNARLGVLQVGFLFSFFCFGLLLGVRLTGVISVTSVS
jgi:hypothetical protein